MNKYVYILYMERMKKGKDCMYINMFLYNTDAVEYVMCTLIKCC